MAGFGGSVKLTGEAEYRKALLQCTQDLAKMSGALKNQANEFAVADKGLKSTDDLQEQLNKSLEEQEKELAKAKTQMANYSVELQKQQVRHKELSKEYNSAVKELDKIGKELGEDSDAYKEQEKRVEALGNELAQSTESMNESKNAMSSLKSEIKSSEKVIEDTKKAMDDLGNESEDTSQQVEKSSEGFTVMKGVLANLATDVIEHAISGLQQLGAKFVEVGHDALDSYAEFEQLSGGVQKLFGDDASKVMDNANKAFNTAGMNANQYMETVTSFSAALIAGLDGDTAKSAEIADRAIQDMADNANTFGTAMESIEATYQGFAKGNFTLLDNLKLGYGGTKEEALRLVKDAGVVADSVKSIDDVSFDQIIESIHIVQEQMNIAGATSKEASTTIDGSTASMKSAWQNMLTGMADENADFKQLASNFVGTLVTPDGKGGVLGTIIPRISTVITGISEAMQTLLPQLIETVVPIIQENLPVIIEAIQGAIETILEVIPTVLPVIVDLIPQIVQTIVGLLPEIIKAGMQILVALINGLTEALPQLIEMLPDIIKNIVTVLIDNLPLIIDAGLQLLMGLVEGIVEALPQLIEMLPTIIETIVQTLIDNLPLLIEASIQIMVALITGLIEALPQLIEMIPQIIVTIVQTLKANWPQIVEAGKQILTSLINGIKSMFSKLSEVAGQIWDKIKAKVSEIPEKMKQWGKDMIQGLVDGIKSMLGRVSEVASDVARAISDFLHFSRPEKGELHYYEQWMPDFMQGMAKSLRESAPMLLDEVEAIASGVSGAMSFEGSFGSGNYAGAVTSESMVSAFKEALSDMKIELDDEVAGKFVEKTVARAIYT